MLPRTDPARRSARRRDASHRWEYIAQFAGVAAHCIQSADQRMYSAYAILDLYPNRACNSAANRQLRRFSVHYSAPDFPFQVLYRNGSIRRNLPK
jgi:hypothetical protein